MNFLLERILKSALPVLACVALPAIAFSGVYRFNGNHINVPSNITVPSGDYREYEARYTLQNDGRLEYKSGSAGALVAGSAISLYPSTSNYNGTDPEFSGRKMGFMAHDGSTVWGMIDQNTNGISDYLEELDADNDGLFDALEVEMGTSLNHGRGYETDEDGDGVPDRVYDVAAVGTPSQYGPSSFRGYLSPPAPATPLMSSSYASYSASYSLSVSFGAGFLDSYLGSFAEWLDLDFGVTYTYTSFLGWRHFVTLNPEAGKKYIMQYYYPGIGWIDHSNIIDGNNGSWSTYSAQLVPSLADLPMFMRFVELGALPPPTINTGGFNILNMIGLGNVEGDQYKLSLPEVLGVPTSVANDLDWSDLKYPGSPGYNDSWILDLDGNGKPEFELDPDLANGEVKIGLLDKQIEITVDENGAHTSLGRFDITRSHDGTFSLGLPTSMFGLGDHSLILNIVPKSIDLDWIEGDSANPLEPNPDSNGKTPGGGLRVFPGKLHPGDNTIDRKKVKLRATLNPPQHGIAVHFKVFDVDDPSSRNSTIDNENHTADNRDSNWNLPNAIGVTNSQGVAEVEFFVGMQPGDNYRAVASSVGPSLFSGLEAKQNDSDQARIFDSNGNAVQPSDYLAISKLLTVWRKMHVEVDSMGSVSGNAISGTITQVNNPPLPWRRVETGQAYSDSTDRFENGVFTSNGIDYPIAGNTGSSNHTFGIKQNSGTATVPSVGASFVAVDDDVATTGSGTPLNVAAPDTSHIKAAFAPAYVEPAFDGGDSTNNHNSGNVSFAANVLRDPTASAVRAQIGAGRGSPVGSKDYWVVYIQGAFQGDFDFDVDPSSESGGTGITSDIENDPDNANVQEGCLIYSETIRDFNLANPSKTQSEAWIVAHEVGHLFVLKASSTDDHASDGSLMDEGNIATPQFNTQDLDDIRRTEVP